MTREGRAVARRVRLDLAYDGTEFHGWQVQPGVRTVQGTVEEALGRIQGSGQVRLRAAGRTDAGVHARSQVADGILETRLDDERLLHALRSMMPSDIRVVGVRTVPHGFHSREAAVSKHYRYCVDRSPWGDPFLTRYALHHPHALDNDAVVAALSRLTGRKDFAGFAGAASEVRTTVRTLTEARFDEDPSGRWATFDFAADGFLNHMVRNLVGTVLDVGRGRFGVARIDEILESRDRTRAGATAPAHGLCLERVSYVGDRGDEARAPRGIVMMSRRREG
jgi:tRNA pseudouridine38-40 synthase